MKLRITILFIAISSLAVGKNVTNYDWQKDRKRYTLLDSEKKLNEYVLWYHREYNYDWENGTLFLFQTEHGITRVINAEAIQRHNRIYVSLSNVLDVVEIKARAINKDGKVTVFDRSNLREIKDDNTDNSYKIFAIEGIEPDSEVEYFYTLKKNWKSSETAYFQFETPIKQGSLLLTCPKQLSFDFRVYFDSAKVHADTLAKRNRYLINFANVEGSVEEKFSYAEANRKRVESKLAFNYTNSRARLNTWTDAAKNYYKYLIKVDDESKKQVERFAKTFGDDKSWPAIKRIKNVEDKIKNSIRIINQSSESTHANVPEILKYKQASVEGVTRLFALTFEELKIPYRIVITCDREVKKFDDSFDSWTYLDHYLFFFPEPNGFLSPNDNVLRYPLIPSKFMSNKGLFIEPVTVGTIKSAIGSIQEIPALPYEAHKIDHVVTVSFNSGIETAIVKQKLVFIGSDAAYISAYSNALSSEEKEKYFRELLDSYTPKTTTSKWTESQAIKENLPQVVIESDFTTNQLIETAGSKILFKVGELIGPQSELYRDETRRTDVENSNNRGYDRELTIEIPKGYKVNNVEALKMNVAYTDGSATPFLFNSDVVLQGANLKIIVKEFYKEIFAPRSRYEDFRKVVNAAADFNKIVLILERI